MWYLNPIKPINQTAHSGAQDRQNQLTKPTGALGQMEEVVIELAGMQGKVCPTAKQLYICTFAGDHGIANASGCLPIHRRLLGKCFIILRQVVRVLV